MTERPRIELAWINVAGRTPPAPGRYLTRRDLAVKEHKHGRREITTVILSAYWDGQAFNTPVQPDYWRDIPEDMKR